MNSNKIKTADLNFASRNPFQNWTKNQKLSLTKKYVKSLKLNNCAKVAQYCQIKYCDVRWPKISCESNNKANFGLSEKWKDGLIIELNLFLYWFCIELKEYACVTKFNIYKLSSRV